MDDTITPFLSHLEEHVQAANRPDALQPLRAASWEKLQALGLTLKLRDLYAQEFATAPTVVLSRHMIQEAILPECLHSHVVLVNGRWAPELSDVSALPSEMVLSFLEEGLLLGALQRSLRHESDPFALLGLALSQRGVFLYMPPRLKSEVLLQILHVTTSPTPSLVAPRVQLVLGKDAHLSCVVTSHALYPEVAHLTVPTWDLLLEEESCLDLFNLSRSAWSTESLRATLKKQARLRSVSLARSTRMTRQSYKVALKEEGADVDLSGLALLGQSDSVHTHVLIEHQAPQTRSMQLFKAVLNDLSRSSFSGKIYVEPVAQQTQAYQLHKTLLLSPHAQVKSEPNLEIGADDVKASHGSTISQLDERQLFYLNARGISKELASQLLIEGFCQEILHKLPVGLT